MTEKDRPLQILLVEDNPVDVSMTRAALGACCVSAYIPV